MAVTELLEQLSDRMAADQTTGTLDHLTTGGDS